MVIERQYADGVISKEQMQEAVAEYFRQRGITPAKASL